MTGRPIPRAVCAAALWLTVIPAWSLELKETPFFAVDVAAGKLPSVAKRVPTEPLIARMDGETIVPGKSGGDARMLIARARDVRMMTVYGYARLVGYDRDFELKPDILRDIKIEDERIFTMTLRQGHKWSDGQPFTTEDFRYYWEDVANNPELSPGGPPVALLINGESPKVEITDAHTVRYSWTRRNPFFLAWLAGTSPLYIYRPAHYLRRFHKKYGDRVQIEKAAEEANSRNWAELHNKLDNMYQFDNPELPTLEPWAMVTRPPALRFIAQRNPYFHRVDPNGIQLPYLDRIVLHQADGKVIAAKAAGGEADLQSRNIAFSDFTFLKENENRSGYRTLLWRTAKGAHVALFPNLNVNDPAWRVLVRDVRFRRALSLAIDREAINQSLYFGLAIEGNNTVLPDSPLFREEYRTAWANFDLKLANKLLDEIGLTKRDRNGIRLMADGRSLEIVVETAGEDSEQTDVLELIGETWIKAGIKLFAKPSQRDVVRGRIYSGETLMSVWSGLENGVPSAGMNPQELAPVSQGGLQWPKWGQYHETMGRAGEKIDLAAAQELFQLNDQWREAATLAARETIWRRMLQIHAEQQFSIGVIGGIYQPVVINKKLRNVPEEAIYNWEPGAFFGVHRPDLFWFDR